MQIQSSIISKSSIGQRWFRRPMRYVIWDRNAESLSCSNGSERRGGLLPRHLMWCSDERGMHLVSPRFLLRVTGWMGEPFTNKVNIGEGAGFGEKLWNQICTQWVRGNPERHSGLKVCWISYCDLWGAWMGKGFQGGGSHGWGLEPCTWVMALHGIVKGWHQDLGRAGVQGRAFKPWMRHEVSRIGFHQH